MANASGTTRLLSMDWLRGWVMVLMALDHASIFLNKGRFALDSALMYKGGVVPLDQFLMRWVTHLCAPTFAFLMGAALALKVSRDLAKQESPSAIDKYLLIRGALLISLDLTMFSAGSGRPLLQVLYALGVGMIALVVLRRLSWQVVLAFALGWFALGEALTTALWTPTSGNAPLWLAPLLGVHFSSQAMIIYPAIHWLAIIALGWCFGLYLHRHRDAPNMHSRAARLLLWSGCAGLALFALIRAFNGYGNMLMIRQTSGPNHPIVQWLLVSKYPPSLAFLGLELGLMALLFAALLLISKRRPFRRNGPIIVFGQTALFFYLLHFLLLASLPPLLGIKKSHSLAAPFVGTLCVLVILYPICRWYRTYKQNHPKSLAQYI